ncbi:hypothetical protein JD969_11610 [Planctomycetota bacterium]|nr:hypothetical protein JD969_11610 [Planctomycetota bacterium]
MPIFRSVKETHASKIYLANHPEPEYIQWKFLRSESISPLTTSGYNRSYTAHNYHEITSLIETFQKYEQQHNQPYPPKQQSQLVAEALQYEQDKIMFDINVENDIISLKQH